MAEVSGWGDVAREWPDLPATVRRSLFEKALREIAHRRPEEKLSMAQKMLKDPRYAEYQDTLREDIKRYHEDMRDE